MRKANGVLYLINKFSTKRISYSNGDKFLHFCILFQFTNSKSTNVLSYGFNYNKEVNYINSQIKIIPVHAEEDAINKLPKIDIKKNKNRNIYVLVVRISSNIDNKLYNSKPCSNCIKLLNTNIEKKGYNLKNIYYSVNQNSDIVDNLGHITCKKINDLINDPDQHTTLYYKYCNKLSNNK